jgi:PhnB protein
MDGSYKPKGYSSILACVVAKGAQGVIDFLIEAFDARQTRRYERLDGGGDNLAFPVWLHVYVPDVDASYERALEAGGVSVDEPKRREGDPDRRGGVKDPAGNTWWIATQVA